MPFRKQLRSTTRGKPARRNYVPRPVKSYVRRAIDRNVEDKFNQLSLVSRWGSLNTTWNEYSFFQPAQGTTGIDRVGGRIRMKSLQITGIIANGSQESALDDPYNVVRIVIAMWKGNSTVNPCTGTPMNQPIMKEIQAATGASLEWLFLDKYIPLQVTSTEKGGGDGYTPGLRTFKYYLKIPYKFSTVTFGDASITYPNRRIIMSVLSDSSATVNPGFVAGYAKWRFEDA